MEVRRMVRMRIDAVKVVGRYRKDLGDIESLAKSIASVSLLNPITVTSDSQLIAGQRRLEACRSLGWEEIDAVIVDDLDTAVARLTAERDENTERKPMTPEELVRLGKVLEELLRPKANARKAQAPGEPRGTKVSSGGAALGELPAKTRQTRDAVGEALGMAGTTYERAKHVVEAAHDESLSPLEQEAAQQALADMNATGNIHGNYDKVRGLRSTKPVAPPKVSVDVAKKQRQIITKAGAVLSGIAHGLKKIEQLHPDITREEAAQWVGDLSETRRVIEQLIKRLKERSNA